MCPSLIQIGSKTAEKNSAQTNRQTNRQTDKHYENNCHLAVNQLFSLLSNYKKTTFHTSYYERKSRSLQLRPSSPMLPSSNLKLIRYGTPSARRTTACSVCNPGESQNIGHATRRSTRFSYCASFALTYSRDSRQYTAETAAKAANRPGATRGSICSRKHQLCMRPTLRLR